MTRKFFRKKRRGWDKGTRQTHDKLNIDQFLSEEADRFIVDQKIIDIYKENHQNREYDRNSVGIAPVLLTIAMGATLSVRSVCRARIYSIFLNSLSTFLLSACYIHRHPSLGLRKVV